MPMPMLSRLPTRATDYCPPRLRDLFDTGRIFLQLLSVAEFNLEHVLDVFSQDDIADAGWRLNWVPPDNLLTLQAVGRPPIKAVDGLASKP